MNTTPDSRIRADWTLQSPPTLGDIDTSTTATPDTSTTAGKISVMAAYDRGEAVQARRLGLAEWSMPKTRKDTGDDPCWDWSMYDYRIAPPPAPRTALQRARERTRAVLVDEATTGDVQLAMLVREIDVAPAVWFGSTLLDQCGIVGHAPGRYRLVRDDA